MALDNYLTIVDRVKNSNVVDFCTTNNFDEEYEFLLPKLPRHEIWEWSTNYDYSLYKKLKFQIENKFGLEHAVFGAGIEELIIRLRVIALQKKWKVCITSPCFYRAKEILNIVNPTYIEEKNIDCDFSQYDIVLYSNPNPLNGNLLDTTILLGLIKKFPKTVFIVDEASMFTIKQWHNYTMMNFTKNEKNLVVFSLFSKMYGFPMLRLSFASGNRNILDLLEKNGPTFPVSSITLKIIESLLLQDCFFESLRNRIATHKDEVSEMINETNVIELLNTSPINCLYVHCLNPNMSLYHKLLNFDILSLNLSEYNLKNNSVRITINSSKKRHAFLKYNLKRFFINLKQYGSV